MAGPSFYPETNTPQAYDARVRILNKILATIIENNPSMTNSNPDFYEEGHEPRAYDSEQRILNKILGATIDAGGSGGGGNALTGNFSGIGDPNGNGELASPGATYTDLTDPVDFVVWRKTSGVATDTGWVPETS